MRLTIAIPTYNRARRLERTLLELCNEVNAARGKSDIQIFVSNNGSTDETNDVIIHSEKHFRANGITFSSRTASQNQGFDANVLACYEASVADYVWFLSDDDNIIGGAVDTILQDIAENHPSVLYYNHDQKPYDRAHPYISEKICFGKIECSNVESLSKIIQWPKLSSLVIKKSAAGLEIPNQNTGFAHVALALQCGIAEGTVVHSPVFTAYPDHDYKDHIDFPPYIQNSLNTSIKWVLEANGRMDLHEQLKVAFRDPLASSLNTLGAYYRGHHTLTRSLRQELWRTVCHEMKSWRPRKLIESGTVKELIKFPISIVYCLVRTAITGRRITKDRKVPSDS